MMVPETYDVFAIRYGRKNDRYRHENFISTDPHDQSLMPLDYYVWAIVNHNRSIVVDTGFDHAEGQRRNRQIMRLPSEGLALLGVDTRQVQDVIITHLHYDHAGTLDDFPQATFHLQDLEMAYATGRFMCHEPLRHAYSAGHVKNMVDKVFNGQVAFHDGDAEIAPGVSVHHIGGHTRGLQCVRVHTQRGWIVLASDASHYYENMSATAPFPIVYHLGDMIEGYAKMRTLADSEQHVIPGHDPLVMHYYPAASHEMRDIVVRLDVAPNV